MSSQLIVSLLIVFISTIIGNTFGCLVKYYPGSESFVCVCNQENCETIDGPPYSSKDYLTIYLSDKSSHRLSKTLIHVNSLSFNFFGLADVNVNINRFNRRQSINGFGGAFTDSTGININKLSTDLADKLINDYFGENGLQYTLSRVPIAGTDFSDRPYSYADTEGDYDLKTFALAPDDFNYKIPYIKKALNLSSELRLFSSPWSPPAWLKTNKRFDGLGILEGSPGSVGWKTWANYIVKFFQAYHENGIDFWGFTTENEPTRGLDPTWKWNALGFSGQMMRDWIKKDLGPALVEAGLTKDKLKMMIFDDSLTPILDWVPNVLSDKEAAQYVSGVAYHWYEPGHYKYLENIHKNFPEYFLLSTEACEGFDGPPHVSLGNWTRAENYMNDIIEGLTRWATGWVDWNLVLDENGGPNWANNQVDAPILVNNTINEYYKQPMYYALGHVSKFLRPGSVNIAHKMKVNSPFVDSHKIKMTAFISPSNEIILTILNRNNRSIKLLIDGLTYRPFTLLIEPRSITTLITKS